MSVSVVGSHDAPSVRKRIEEEGVKAVVKSAVCEGEGGAVAAATASVAATAIVRKRGGGEAHPRGGGTQE